MAERSELKVFGQAFFKKLAGCRAEPYDLALIDTQRMRKSQGNSMATFGCLRLSRTVAQLPSQSRLPPCQLSRRESQVSPPPLGGAGAQWAPFSA